MGSLPWQHLYDSGFWARRRRLQLIHEPLCRMCRERGLATPASVADHIEPHRGDINKFKLGALQSLCEDCHNSLKKYIELRGYGIDVGDDGWPTDPKHPANRLR
jgi:5-methylcytosine-specific restriction enzyme A